MSFLQFTPKIMPTVCAKMKELEHMKLHIT
jgi:hypothetical protein